MTLLRRTRFPLCLVALFQGTTIEQGKDALRNSESREGKMPSEIRNHERERCPPKFVITRGKDALRNSESQEVKMPSEIRNDER